MLSDIKIRTLKPRTKTYKVADGQALSISVTPKGGKSWYYRYRRPDGRQYDLHLGRYPELSLKNARRMRDDAKSTLANGRDPAIEKQLQKERLEDTFEAMGLLESAVALRPNEIGFGHPATSLGWIYLTGKYPGISRNTEEALRWNLLGAGSGHTNALSNLAMMYAEGIGVERDYSIMLNYILSCRFLFNHVPVDFYF